MEGRTEFGAPLFFCSDSRRAAPFWLGLGSNGRPGTARSAPSRRVRVCLRARASVPDGLRRRRRWTLESARSIGRSRPRDPVAFFGHLGDRWVVG
jgi:hypothetical protein